MQTSDKVGSIVTTGCTCTYLAAHGVICKNAQRSTKSERARGGGRKRKEKRRLGCVVDGGGSEF